MPHLSIPSPLGNLTLFDQAGTLVAIARGHATGGAGSRLPDRAAGRNPIPIVIPCHRVLAAKGAVGGYSGMGGLETKRFLLRLEAMS